MRTSDRNHSERTKLAVFRAIPGKLAPRDAQDLMAFPFFSLSKTSRILPIDFRTPDVTIRVEATGEYGMATIWDADVLIWAASQIVEARDAGRCTSRLMVATPHEILAFIGRGDSARDYERLEAALDRLQSTTIKTSLRHAGTGQLHRFSWINEWKRHTTQEGRARVVELILPDWFYQAVLDDALVLTIDPAYFRLTGGLERWLYRLVRKHGGRQRSGWKFDFQVLHLKSASLSPYRRFAFELRAIVRRQPLPGYRLTVERTMDGREILTFSRDKLSTGSCGQTVSPSVLSGTPEPAEAVISGTAKPCLCEQKSPNRDSESKDYDALNLESNLKESNFKDVGTPPDLWITPGERR
ncbi:replication initiator protein A [Gluconacetobacter tumulisoli]|uniref:Replication initiator protein A n=1 Tax=Gluconacetobacter tumulisoli TaxID=1286189 RepID=A0A7W4K741_9PROT|nr:replication initiator protein A [Gluconacetobacter tumulisoli]MBB2201614.1 replication initiator protein A [Gluconacetobacter tumulisoli]